MVVIEVEHNGGYSFLIKRASYAITHCIIDTRTEMMEFYLGNKKFSIIVFNAAEKDLGDEWDVKNKIKPTLFLQHHPLK